jgi:NADPH-dependent curcumin reductase CurA
MQYKAIRLVKRPELQITPDSFEVVSLHTPALQAGEILLKQTHMSLDPAMRGWMSADKHSYIAPVELGEIMRSSGAAEVVESKNDKFPVGTRLTGMFGWTEYLISNGKGLQPIPDDIDVEAALCVLGLPGLTAYHGFSELASPASGETIVISGAAGSVGSMVGQLAKLEGLRVVGVAGSDEKCSWLQKELGFDVALNYRDPNLKKTLAAAVPNGVDIYFENTGGPIQQFAYDRMNVNGRIIVCGMIADYNASALSPGPNWLNMVRKRLTIKGYAMPDHWRRFPEISGKLAATLREGKLHYRAHVIHGLESAIEGINLLFSGGNNGKLLVQL